MQIEDDIRRHALELGFDACRFTGAGDQPEDGAALAAFLAEGRHGDMAWMADTARRRSNPRALWPEARSVIVLGVNYAPAGDPLALAGRSDRGAISVYARNRDYHDPFKRRLKALAGWLHRAQGAEVKVFVDTAPVMEKPLAARAGLGWRGRHTNLVSRRFGSWLFLGEVFTTLALAPDPPQGDLCGSCARCHAACPTGALTGRDRIDARRCVSYLTIEHKGTIDPALRPLMGNRIYGCDDCLAVCPWNKFAPTTRDPDFIARAELAAPRLGDLAQLDEAGFRKVFAGSPIKRIGRDRFLRNVLIAIGNSGRPELVETARARLDESSPLVRAMAVWALARLLPPPAFRQLAQQRAPTETDAEVAEEWSHGRDARGAARS